MKSETNEQDAAKKLLSAKRKSVRTLAEKIFVAHASRINFDPPVDAETAVKEVKRAIDVAAKTAVSASVIFHREVRSRFNLIDMSDV